LNIGNAEVAEKFGAYPDGIRQQLLFLRQLVLETASELSDVGEVEETLKWGEPSYATRKGSPIRIDWKRSTPEHYAMYFNCRTSLVETFKELLRDQFVFEGNRAISFNKNADVPVDELKLCISLALTYHQVKHLPMLGV
jgi:hypothetical protein